MKMIIRKISLLSAILYTSTALVGCNIVTALKLDGKPDTSPVTSNGIFVSPGIKDTPNATSAELVSVFKDAFDCELVMMNCWSLEYGYNNAYSLTSCVERYVTKAGLLRDTMKNALESVKEHCVTKLGCSSIATNFQTTLPSWQYLASILPLLKGNELADVFSIKLRVDDPDSKRPTLVADIAPLAISETAVLLAKDDANTYLDIRFSYAYLTSLYDAYGNESTKDFKFDPEYIKTLTFPLPTSYEFCDTWCSGRSQNTRKHMGTDIKAAEGTNILCCSDGVVLYTGTADIPGNYVIIMDELGFEYHYYHLVQPTTHVKPGDKVTKGQIIGNVGNTGNSDANHLHLTLICPDGYFVNPYELLTALQARFASNN